MECLKIAELERENAELRRQLEHYTKVEESASIFKIPVQSTTEVIKQEVGDGALITGVYVVYEKL